MGEKYFIFKVDLGGSYFIRRWRIYEGLEERNEAKRKEAFGIKHALISKSVISLYMCFYINFTLVIGRFWRKI